jgi:hypothetical protein
MRIRERAEKVFSRKEKNNNELNGWTEFWEMLDE